MNNTDTEVLAYGFRLRVLVEETQLCKDGPYHRTERLQYRYLFPEDDNPNGNPPDRECEWSDVETEVICNDWSENPLREVRNIIEAERQRLNGK